ncbi:hypothetical protein D3C74_368260 [compost metagenome]
MQSLKALQEQPGVERRNRCSQITQQLYPCFDDVGKRTDCFRVDQTVVARVRLSQAGEFAARFPIKFPAVHNYPADRRSVPANEFSSGMDNDVCPKFNRTEQVRTRERIIHNQRDSVLMGDSRHGLDVQHIPLRIADRFSVKRLRLVRDRTAEVLRVIGINKMHLNSQLGKCS